MIIQTEDEDLELSDRQRINWEYLDSHYGEIIDEMFAIYLDHVDMYLKKLDHAVTRYEHRNIASAAHALKGAAVNVGAERLADMCRTIEEHGISRNLQNIEKEVDAVLIEVVELKKTMADYLTHKIR